jgi:hypothetical protein
MTEENWTGGSYDLTMKLSTPNQESVQSALEALWRLAPIKGCVALASRDPFEMCQVETSARACREHSLLRGVVGIPGLGELVCGVGLQEFAQGGTWLHFGLPMGALALLDPRIGGFPFGDDGGQRSLEWRLPIDSWLANLALGLNVPTPIDTGVIGFDAPELGDYDSGVQMSCFGLLEQVDGELRYAPATT